jgi:hypothetical protein
MGFVGTWGIGRLRKQSLRNICKSYNIYFKLDYLKLEVHIHNI